MITTETLKKIYHKINAPILIYSPDMTPMTGGCFYFNNCTRYTQGCGFCPGLNSSILEDNSRRNYYIKKDNYAQMNVSFLGNTWMNQYVKRSLLFPSDRIFKTEIVIDEVKFRPLNQTSIRRELGLPIDGFIIMLRSTPDIRKGNKDMKRVIDKFVKKLTADEQTNVCILTVGNDYFSSICDISSTYSIFDLGIVDKTLLIKAYNASDLFLCASIDDAGPSMINQSLMCGTPVVSYKIGTTLDVIESGKSGFYSDIRDVNTMAENVHRIGANGYIGRHVVSYLLDREVEVIVCDIRTENVDSRATCIDFDLFNLSDSNVFGILGSPDVCLHMAWRNGFVHNASTQMGDISAHYKFLTALIDGGLKHLAIMGSMHEVGYWEGAINENTPCNPLSMYGIAKNALRQSMEIYCKQKDIIFQWLRCYYILGDDRHNNSIFCKILMAAEEGKKTFPFTTGKNKYDFINVDELAKLISATVTQTAVNGIINCCTGNPISLAERVERFIKEHNLDIKLEYGAFPDRPYDSPCVYGNPSKIQEILANS